MHVKRSTHACVHMSCTTCPFQGSSDESSGDVKKTPKTQSKRGGRGSAQSGRGRGGTQKKPVRKPPEHIVSIPTDLINSKQVTGKKRKSVDVS